MKTPTPRLGYVAVMNVLERQQPQANGLTAHEIYIEIRVPDYPDYVYTTSVLNNNPFITAAAHFQEWLETVAEEKIEPRGLRAVLLQPRFIDVYIPRDDAIIGSIYVAADYDHPKGLPRK